MESQFFKVGEFVVNSRSNAIHRKGHRSVLAPRLMDLLLFFAARPGEVVTRQEIVENCWSRGCVTDQVITQAIFELRRALKDGRPRARCREYIKTVQKRGYRLVVEVDALTPEQYFTASGQVPGTENATSPILAATVQVLLEVDDGGRDKEGMQIESNVSKAPPLSDSDDLAPDKPSMQNEAVSAEKPDEMTLTEDLNKKEQVEGKKKSLLSKVSSALWLDQIRLGFKKGAY